MGATGLVLLASAGVLCVLCLCIGNGRGRVAPAQQTHNCEVQAQQGAVNREMLLGRSLELQRCRRIGGPRVS